VYYLQQTQTTVGIAQQVGVFVVARLSAVEIVVGARWIADTAQRIEQVVDTSGFVGSKL
jgi:hypothetical protein